MNRRLLILLGVLALLVILVLVSGRKPKPKIEPLFPELQTDQVAQIEISRGEDSWVLKKEVGQWVVATKDNYPADSDAVQKLLDKIVDFKKTLLESKTARFHEKYGVDASGMQVKLLGSDDATLAHFYIGRAESDWSNTFVRAEGEDQVYRIPESIMSTFDKGTRGWRDRTIFKFNDYEISKLVVNTEEESYELEADRSSEEVKWSLTSPEASPAKKDVVERMANALSTLQTDDFPESQDLTTETTGLDEPTSKVEATLTDGTTRVLLIGKRKDESGPYYVQRVDKDTVFLLNQWRVNQLLKKLEDIKEEPPAEEEPAETSDSSESSESSGSDTSGADSGE